MAYYKKIKYKHSSSVATTSRRRRYPKPRLSTPEGMFYSKRQIQNLARRMRAAGF